MSARVRVDVISDVVCPWCYVGKRRLERARALAPEIEIEVRWLPFQLDASIPPGGIPRATYLARKFGSAARASEIFDRVRQAGAEEGIPFAFDKIAVSPNTLDAHRVLHWAGPQQDAAKERLLAAYFLEGVDLAARAELARLAGEAGLDRDEVARRLATDEDVEAVTAAVARAHEIGVSGVPFFIFGGRYALSGAQPPDVLAQGVRQAAAES